MHGTAASGTPATHAYSPRWLARRPVLVRYGVPALAAALLVVLTVAVTVRLSAPDPAPLTSELHVDTGVVDEVQGLTDEPGAALGVTSRVVCVATETEEVGSGECYTVPKGHTPDAVPQVGQRVRILHGFVPYDLADPEAGRVRTLVALEILPD